MAGNTTIGTETLENRELYSRGYFFWLSLGALLGLAIIFNIGFTLALTFLNGKFNFKIKKIKKIKKKALLELRLTM